MLEVVTIIVMVTRSLTLPRESLDTCRGQSCKVKEISKDRISEQVKSHRVIFVARREGGGEAENTARLSGAKCAECP